MKILVCGGRNFNDYKLLKDTLDGRKIDRIIHGGARGADTLAGRYAEANSIPTDVFNAEWDSLGKAAGIIRNLQMLEEGLPDLVIAFEGGRGTRNMVEIAKKAGVTVVEVPPILDGL